ncbi:glycine--tRNA ligase-like isoform X2 [Acropora millepora]|uniref:glycine--tRNA ligase-like isoform X2 n=1 Tax=Acropora millepora TaxID=45264 RepID=UPI001CF3F3E6|nr:glycine--tRNA ligase-like isoform X2 [Acropora millepora]
MSRSLLDKIVKLCESRGFSIESSIEAVVGTRRGNVYDFGPFGTELLRNLRNAWWHDVVLSKSNVYGFERNFSPFFFSSQSSLTSMYNKKEKDYKFAELGPKSSNEEVSWTCEDINKLIQLVSFIPGITEPFGFANHKRYINLEPSSEKYLLRSCEKEVMGLQFFCAENRVSDWINFWKRQRLVWWRKFANVRSNFSLYEEQSNLEPGVNSQTFVQYAFPWGKETVDSLTVRSDLRKHLTVEQKTKLMFNKDSIPHIIQITSNLNAGFLSFLMDGFSEMEQSDSSGNVSLHTVLHLHPQLAPVKVGVLSETQQRELCDVALQTSADLQKAGRDQHPLFAANKDKYR